MPIAPGRNTAILLEIAARNHLLKLQGHHSARDFADELHRRLEAEARPLDVESTEKDADE